VPAGQLKNAAPSGARSAGKSATLENPAHLPTLPIVTRRAKTTGLVRVANRAGCPKGSARNSEKASAYGLYTNAFAEKS
jgi:hypothetical protein